MRPEIVKPDAHAPATHPIRLRLKATDLRPGRLVETALFALVAPVLGALVAPADPLGLGAGFPWVVAGPVVLAARYGSVWGLACAGLAALACQWQAAAYADRPFALVTLVVGTLVMALAVGEIGLAWRRRSARAEAESAYLKRRLEEFSNEHHVLQVSHGLLQEALGGRRMSLREALQRIERAAPVERTSARDAFGAHGELMAVLAQFCSVQVAGLYAVRGSNALDPEPVATHGDMAPPEPFDPLLRACMTERRLASVRPDAHALEADETGLLAAVPIVDAEGRLHGVVAVREMHFMAFQQENLNLMALIGAWLGHRVGRANGFSDSPAERFHAELDLALRLARAHGIPSSLVCLRLADDPRAAEVASGIADDLRSLDRAWLVDGAVTVLLPLSTERQAEAYASRMIAAVHRRHGVDPRTLVTDLTLRTLVGDDTRERALDFIARATNDAAGLPQDDGARAAA